MLPGMMRVTILATIQPNRTEIRLRTNRLPGAMNRPNQRIRAMQAEKTLHRPRNNHHLLSVRRVPNAPRRPGQRNKRPAACCGESDGTSLGNWRLASQTSGVGGRG